MRLADLMREMEAASGPAGLDCEVTGLALDSRRVRPGDLFFALRGVAQDGQGFTRQALERGACAAVVEASVPGEGPLVRVPEPRKAMAQAAAAFHGHPSRALQLVGVTGTNGKTTTTYWVESILREAGIPSGLIGTTGYRLAGELRPAAFTTPESPELQALLAEMVRAGTRAVAIEISSHALVQRRAFGAALDVAVFTNLSHDHLDYHGTLERYLDAKLMMFDGRNETRSEKPCAAVVNADDPRAAQVSDAARRHGMVLRRYGTSAEAEIRITAIAALPAGLGFDLVHGGRSRRVALPHLGRHNAWNAAAAWGSAVALGVDPDLAAAALAQAPAVPGRLERVHAGQPFTVVVDYAHTPEALEKSLAAVREHHRGRLLLVFGCGGDRDRAKRPIMGRVAALGSDLVWVTNDNPRSESPEAIAREITAGATGHGLEVVLDRRAAIAEALSAARAGDAILIAGKGHETTQTLGDQVLPFDDRAVVRELIASGSGEPR